MTTEAQKFHPVTVTFSKYNTARRVTLRGRDHGHTAAYAGTCRQLYLTGPRGATYGMHIYENGSWRVWSMYSSSMNDIAGGRDAAAEVTIVDREPTPEEVAHGGAQARTDAPGYERVVDEDGEAWGVATMPTTWSETDAPAEPAAPAFTFTPWTDAKIEA